MTLDLKAIRELKRQFCSSDVLPNKGNFVGIALPQLTVDGVVMVGSAAMRPETFKDFFGLAAYEYLLKQPRIPNPYGDDLDS